MKNHEPKISKQQRKTGTCSICNKVYVDVQEHINMVHLRKYACNCPVCGSNFVTKAALEKHIRIIHNQEKELECLICKKRFAYKDSLQKHLELHERRGAKAPIANIQQRMHHEEDFCYTCRKCVGDMKSHADAIHPDLKFQCDICFRRFKMRDSVSRHKKIFHDENPTVYYCDYCPRSFLYKDLLKKHFKDKHKFDIRQNIRPTRSRSSRKAKSKDLPSSSDFNKKPRKKIVANRPFIIKPEDIDHEQLKLLEEDESFHEAGVPIHQNILENGKWNFDPEDRTSTELGHSYFDDMTGQLEKIKEEDVETPDIFVENLPVIQKTEFKTEIPDEYEEMGNFETNENRRDGQLEDVIMKQEPEDFLDPFDVLNMEYNQNYNSEETDVLGNVGDEKPESLQIKSEPSDIYQTITQPKKLVVQVIEEFEDVPRTERDQLMEKSGILRFDCNQCGKNFYLKSAYLNHVKSHQEYTLFSNRAFKCGVCKFSTDDSNEHDRHIRTEIHHENQKRYSKTCVSCRRIFNSINDLRIHAKKEHKTVERNCEKCSTAIHSELERTIHEDEDCQKTKSKHQQETFSTTNISKVIKRFDRISQAEKQHLMRKYKIEEFNCLHCKKVYYIHVDRHDSNSEFKLNCIFCKKSVVIKKKEADIFLKKYICDHCENEYDHQTSFLEHVKKHFQILIFKCEICVDYSTSQSCLLKRHCRSQSHFEREKESRICCHCNEMFDSTNELKNHTQLLYRKEHEKCYECKIEFYSVLDRRNHSCKLHKSLQAKTCVKCRTLFSSRAEVEQHTPTCKRKPVQKTKTNNEIRTVVVDNEGTTPVLRCSFCGEGFKQNRHAVNKHIIQIHENGAKPMRTCQLCQLDFKTFIEYEAHVKLHVNESVCCTCGAYFKTPEELVRHAEVHRKTIEEKKFKCSVCGHAFMQNNLMQAHMLKHTGDYQYECESCQLKFRCRSNYTYHMKKYHDADGKSFVSFKFFFTSS